VSLSTLLCPVVWGPFVRRGVTGGISVGLCGMFSIALDD
jgi:hypothetical protein